MPLVPGEVALVAIAHEALAFTGLCDGGLAHPLAGLCGTQPFDSGEHVDLQPVVIGGDGQRLGTGEELAFMVVDLITNPYMNGEVVRVDGGIRMPPK